MTFRKESQADATRIGILTSGGDAPGMNAVVAATWQSLEARGTQPVGIAGGFAGLAAGTLADAESPVVAAYRLEPGTWLGTSRWPQLATSAGVETCRASLEQLGLAGLVVVGGGGSGDGARALAELVPTAFVPATIDGDVAGTALTIGCDSAVAYGVDAVKRLRITGRSLGGRAFVVQTLGAPTGRLADAVAAAAGVEHALVPERPHELVSVARRLTELAADGEAVVVMSEAIGDAVAVADELAELSGLRVHPTILGHAQRAAFPSTLDLELAAKAGVAAADAVADGRCVFVGFSADGAVAPSPLPSSPNPQGAS
ncbi:MAG TPA: 6-phosphofructokinase [Conexibacter sp.]|nr:6-phosphofructokinase [Conexibacter sp.]